MKVKYLLIILSAAILIGGCNKTAVKPQELIQYVKDSRNGLIKSKTVNGFDFYVMKEPLEYKIATVLQNSPIDKTTYNKSLKELGDMQYYIVKIGVLDSKKSILKYNIVSEEDYQNRLAYFSFGFQNAIKIQQRNKIYECDLFHFERSYDLTNYRTFVLGFPDDQNSEAEDRTLIIDSDFFDSIPIKFKFKGEDIKNTPKLILSKTSKDHEYYKKI